jgi:hypothetical protein
LVALLHATQSSPQQATMADKVMLMAIKTP